MFYTRQLRNFFSGSETDLLAQQTRQRSRVMQLLTPAGSAQVFALADLFLGGGEGEHLYRPAVPQADSRQDSQLRR